jgi:hypothetical protein
MVRWSRSIPTDAPVSRRGVIFYYSLVDSTEKTSSFGLGGSALRVQRHDAAERRRQRRLRNSRRMCEVSLSQASQPQRMVDLSAGHVLGVSSILSVSCRLARAVLPARSVEAFIIQ